MSASKLSPLEEAKREVAGFLHTNSMDGEKIAARVMDLVPALPREAAIAAARIVYTHTDNESAAADRAARFLHPITPDYIVTRGEWGAVLATLGLAA